MKKNRAIALTAASAAILSLSFGVSMAQTVSGGDPYTQGYAAGASAKERNTLNAFDSGYKAGQQVQSSLQTDSLHGFDQGYAAGVAQADKNRQEAYNQGYEARSREEQRVAEQAFENGFDAGSRTRPVQVLEFP